MIKNDIHFYAISVTPGISSAPSYGFIKGLVSTTWARTAVPLQQNADHQDFFVKFVVVVVLLPIMSLSNFFAPCKSSSSTPSMRAAHIARDNGATSRL